MRILVIGDSHIPRRASEVPPIIMDKLEQLTTSHLFDYTFFTGDLIKAPNFIQFLKIHTKNDVFIVVGNMDYYGGNRNASLNQKLNIPIGKDEIKIGLIHGHQISPRGDHSQLELVALENSYNILLSGHTHKEEIFLTKNHILLLNPGSVTGAWSFLASQNPSFIIIDIDEQTNNLSITLYKYNIRALSFEILNFDYYFDQKKIRAKN